ncbi:MAG TPA: IS66 family transposase [Micromonosporaceae bacterium]|nr:IS66 family transposase [Micromonosporaceae bacterium]
MEAPSPSAEVPLPDDVVTLQRMVRELLAEVARLRAENAELKGKLDAALKHRFGRRSERRRKPKRAADDDRPAPRRDEHGRGPLPGHLERREVVHDLAEAERPCPCCGTPRVCIGEQAAEQLDLEPARFFVLRTVKKTYACRRCDPALVPAEQRLQTAGPEQVGPIAKGLCGPGLLAHCVTAKFADHTPLHRLAGQLGRSGVRVAASTLGGWLAGAAVLLDPLYQLLHRRVLHSRVLHGDDTPVKLRVPGCDRTKKAHLWVAVGDADYPYVVFDFTADYTAAGPGQFLEGYRGYLQADALAQYEGLYGPGRVLHCCCWAHARRKFVAAAEAGDERGNAALGWIRQLYAIERGLPPLLPPADDPPAVARRRQREEVRRALRQQQAGPVLLALKGWLDEQRPQTLPKSPLGAAVGYALNNWEALSRYQEQGYLAIDNNLSERTLRGIALGRNAWGVIGSEAGGQTAAVLYSVVGTCRHLGLDPFAYLREALPGLFALAEKPTAEQLLDWLPDRWLLRRGRDSPSAPTVAG